MKQPIENVHYRQIENLFDLQGVGKMADSLPFEGLLRPVFRWQALYQQPTGSHPTRSLARIGRLVLKQPEMRWQLFRAFKVVFDAGREA